MLSLVNQLGYICCRDLFEYLETTFLQRIKKSALVMQTPEQMFGIVADIEAYPQFLNWCSGARILENPSEQEIVAVVDIAYKGIEQSFSTRNHNKFADSIQMELAGDHSSIDFLQGNWAFTPIQMEQSSGCKVEFNLEFSMKNKIASTIFKTVFSQIINTQVDGFVQRANELYG